MVSAHVNMLLIIILDNIEATMLQARATQYLCHIHIITGTTVGTSIPQTNFLIAFTHPVYTLPSAVKMKNFQSDCSAQSEAEFRHYYI